MNILANNKEKIKVNIKVNKISKQKQYEWTFLAKRNNKSKYLSKHNK